MSQSFTDVFGESVPGQNPWWLLGIYDENEIEFLDPIWVVEIVVCGQVQISDHLVSPRVVGRCQAHRSQIFGFDEDNPVFVRDGYVHLGDPLTVFSADRWSVLFPELKGEVLKGVTAEVNSLDCLSQESSQPNGGVQVLEDAKNVCGQQVFARCTDNERAV